MEDLSIKVNILGRTYPLKVRKDDEERVKAAAQLISERIREYEQQYAVTDKTDLLSMCALQLANELLSGKEKLAFTEKEAGSKLDALDRLIGSALQQ
ncbi:MAG TPA: cell division protein ZapA [Bacteroidia bacterium]|nr:cell division protein ZapA [Bacteroidia bacterium]